MADRLLGGRYRLEEMLGRGGMGRVWRAGDELLGRTIAVKEVLLSAETTADKRAELCDRTMREARAAAALTHSSIVTVHDVLIEDGRPWIVMDLIRGQSLEGLRVSTGPLPPRQVARIGLQLLDALAVAHHHGVLHRDIKPHNVLIADDGHAVLTDFGIASTVGDQGVTRAGMVIGSPGYMAPERLREGERAGPSSDLWSLAATLYTAVEGVPPFGSHDPLAMLGVVLTQPPAPPRLAGPLGPILVAMLDKQPAARPGPDKLRQVLRAVAEASPPTGPVTDVATRHGPMPGYVPGPAMLPPTSSPRRPPSAGTGVVAVIVVLVTVIVVLVVGGVGLAVVRAMRESSATASGATTPTVTSSRASTAGGSPLASSGPGGRAKSSPAGAPDACSLLTSAQAAELTGVGQGRANGVSACTWSDLTITVEFYPDRANRSGTAAASDAFTLQRKQAENQAGTDTGDPAAIVNRSVPTTLAGAAGRSFVQDKTVTGPWASVSSCAVLLDGPLLVTLEAKPQDGGTQPARMHTLVATGGKYVVGNLASR